MEKVNGYFGLQTRSDCVFYWGTFIVGGALYTIDMFIAWVL